MTDEKKSPHEESNHFETNIGRDNFGTVNQAEEMTFIEKVSNVANNTINNVKKHGLMPMFLLGVVVIAILSIIGVGTIVVQVKDVVAPNPEAELDGTWNLDQEETQRANVNNNGWADCDPNFTFKSGAFETRGPQGAAGGTYKVLSDNQVQFNATVFNVERNMNKSLIFYFKIKDDLLFLGKEPNLSSSCVFKRVE
ncbi:hypothetical protein [Laceyella putida]|uniref:Uncharacterized protein n=1 Tax=Laceyella putida TaxID=110101 RepID=A0ABW2RQW2_9BACL